jgi:hypothetical protein
LDGAREASERLRSAKRQTKRPAAENERRPARVNEIKTTHLGTFALTCVFNLLSALTRMG